MLERDTVQNTSDTTGHYRTLPDTAGHKTGHKTGHATGHNRTHIGLFCQNRWQVNVVIIFS